MIKHLILKKILLLILLLICLSVNAQKNKKAIKLFEKGVKAFEQKDYKTADSLFTLSEKMEPHKDTYFNLAATKNKLGDFCGFCENMDKASFYGDSYAGELYNKNCIIKDSVSYNVKNFNYSYYCIISYSKCLKTKKYQFFRVEARTKKKVPFTIILKDSLKFTEKDFDSPSFDIEAVPNENISYLAPEMPSFPGGNYALDEYIYNCLKSFGTPSSYCNGTVYVGFDIEPDGTLSNIHLINSIGKNCDDESIRIVKSMPKWIPAKMDGNPIKSSYMVYISFHLL